jgi:hypothetical protein
MSRVLLFSWLAVSALAAVVSARLWAPHGVLWLYALVVWALLLVPISFHVFFTWYHGKEQRDVVEAMRAWTAREHGAGKVMARALEEALEEQDERALTWLLTALEHDAASMPLVRAVRDWLVESGGRSAREARRREAQEAMRAVSAHLASI